MEQRYSLEAAGKLFGISANAMRARAKKTPEKYRVERDNGGKIWLWIDPENLPAAKVRKVSADGSKLDELKASIDTLKEHAEAVADLRERLAGAEIRAVRAETERDAAIARAAAAEADRERWQAMAERLADRPGWWARLWRR